MTERYKQRRKMVDNNGRFRAFYLTHGRDFLQEILEVYTSPGHLHEKLVKSEYYSSLSRSNQELLSSIKTGNTYADLELEQIYDFLLDFTKINKSDNGEENKGNPAVLLKNLELFMSLWRSVKSSNVMLDKDFKTNVNTLKDIADYFATHFGFGKSFKDTIDLDFEDMDERPISIQLVSSGKDVNVQIGQNNKCFLNVEVFDHLQNEGEPTVDNDNDDLVKMIIHARTTSTSGIEVAQIEKKLLISLSGEQLEEINKDLQERFGVQIVVARKGCVVLVLQKTHLIANCLKDENMVKELLSVLFELVGFSNNNLSEISLRVDLTLGDKDDVDVFKKSQLNGKGLELTLSPKTNIKSMAKERKKDLVSTILCSVADLNSKDDNSELQVEAHFITDKMSIVRENIPQNQPKDKAFDGIEAKKPRCSTKKQLVAAIDFGTAYKNDPIKNIPQNQPKDKAFDGREAKKPQCSTNKQLVASIDFGTAYKNDPIKNIPQNQSKDKAFDGIEAKQPKSSTNKQLAAAIDFGTAYSGHAFSSRGDFKNDPLRIRGHKWSKDLIKGEPQDIPKHSEKNTNCLIAAIDFGTTHSGHAFSFIHDYKKDPLNITAHKWSTDSLTHKTPTSALFDENKTLIAFGYEAEKQFRELSEDNKHHDHYFFERFKMQLYNKSGDKKKKKLTNKSMICDISRKELSAMDVFSKAIGYMHDHLLKILKEQDDNEIAEEEIKWVLTVPAIWDDSAKQFIKDAAKQAGIRSENLIIALELEAASTFCKKVPLVKLSGPESEFQIFSPGNQYLILDAGGGTVDIAIHEVLPGDNITELHKANGGTWGGTYLDDGFFKIFEECFGKDEFENFKKDDLAGYIELRKDLEIKKRDIISSTQKMSLIIPLYLISKCDTTRSEFAEYLVCKGDKLEFDGSMIQKWYSKVCNNIVEHVKKLLEEHEIDFILMVGGFSESKFLQETMTKAFPNKYIVVPNDASLAVLKGAVLFGHKPSSIISRVAKFTYGVETSLPIKDEETVLDKKRIEIIDGVRYERGVFSKHVTKGANLEVDKAQYEMAYLPLLKNQKTIRFRVYTSSLENPKYIDDPECRPLGYINVDIPDSSEGLDRKVRVRFIFGGTEIKVEGVNERTGEIASVKFVYSDTTEEQRFLCKPDD